VGAVAIDVVVDGATVDGAGVVGGANVVGTGTVFYLIVSIQGSLQAQMSVNQTVHFSDWVVGHSHLAMLGFATFAAPRIIP